VAQRISPIAGTIIFGDLEHAVDQLFEDLLVSRWRGPQAAQSLVVDRGEHYEVRIGAPGADPTLIEVEVTERRLNVRIPGPARAFNHSFELPLPVETVGVIARWSGEFLEIKLPKKPGRKIKVE
jgi:HSP20 family molecular chaperone IbpA